jgi:predicted  nucleic acid-binding Zn-ribbon protein
MNLDEFCRAYTAQGVELQKAKERLTQLTAAANELRALAEKLTGELKVAETETANKDVLITALRDQLEASKSEA